MLPRFEIVHRTRPVALVADERRSGFRAPFVAVEAALDDAGSATCELSGPGGVRLRGWYDADRGLAGLAVTDAAGRTTRHHSRRNGRPDTPPDGLAATLTGRWLSVLTRTANAWTVRGRVDLLPRVDPHDAGLLSGLTASATTAGWRSGVFGGLGFRDVHLVTEAEGDPVERDGRLFLTVTHAGPGFADTAHCGVWSWTPETQDLAPVGRLWFRRDGRVLGDHATHLVRHDGRWLVATSTWGDFDRTTMGIRLGESTDDLLTGEHVVETRPLDLPTPRPTVGTWDPHLALVDGHWHVAFVAARRYFDFRPALARATHPGRLDGFALLGSAEDRRATEGTVLQCLDGTWRLLASDGADNRAGLRERFPVFDLGVREVGVLDAPYPGNIPWPTLVQREASWHLATFDGTPYGGEVAGYGTHGDLVLMRSVSPPPET